MTDAATTDRVKLASQLCGLPDSAVSPPDTKAESVLDRLRALLVCPACRSGLDWGEGETRCSGCGAVYEVVDEIPVLRAGAGAGDAAHKEQQEAFFDAADPEFEITRPHGTPWLYGWLLGEKFKRSLTALEPLPSGLTAVTVCGGSGMDAEFLARVGATVVSTDLSLGAARRARERAARYGLAVLPVVADAEALPLADASIDLAYVHDGLHHLESPLVGLREMARVAEWAVSVNEPARAAATHAAIKVGLSVVVEEAGNRVERIEPAEVVAALEENGFSVRRCARYGMVYRHEPGRAARVLSAPGLRSLTRLVVDLFNVSLGRIGNKLTVQAVRRATSPPSGPATANPIGR